MSESEKSKEPEENTGKGLTPGELLELEANQEAEGKRLDQWLTEELGGDVSRSQLKKWFDQGLIRRLPPKTENDAVPQPVKGSFKLGPADRFQIEVPPPVLPDLEPRDLNLRIIHEDQDLAVIVKPPGLAVHPGPGDQGVTLINGLLHIWRDLPDSDQLFRPGIVHRLDKFTEGLLLIAKNEVTLRKLSAQFKERRVFKEYLAWLLASPAHERATLKMPIERHPSDRLKMRVAEAGQGKAAETSYEITRTIVSKKTRKFCEARITIATGRTHQIRVHLSAIGAPIVGDPLYSRTASRYEKYGLLLLARKLGFTHPTSGKTMEFELDLPQRFQDFARICVNY